MEKSKNKNGVSNMKHQAENLSIIEAITAEQVSPKVIKKGPKKLKLSIKKSLFKKQVEQQQASSIPHEQQQEIQVRPIKHKTVEKVIPSLNKMSSELNIKKLNNTESAHSTKHTDRVKNRRSLSATTKSQPLLS